MSAQTESQKDHSSSNQTDGEFLKLNVKAHMADQNGTANGDAGELAAVQEKINTDIVTLTRFLTEEQVKHKEATGDFTYASDFNLLL